jgi:crossover junction endonuclease MUS81
MRLRGLSVEKAYAIVQKYPTITHLVKTYEDCSSEKDKELLLSGVFFGNNGRTIGPAISKAIYKLYNSSTLPY